jgi:hypothetical protein
MMLLAHCVMQVCGGNAGALKQAATYFVSLGGWQPGECEAVKGSFTGTNSVFFCNSISNLLVGKFASK